MSFNESIFNKMSDMQWERLSRRLSGELESAIDDQTLQFWHLQLQFMELDGLSVEELYKSIRHSLIYVKNEFTRKLDKIIDSRDDFSEDDRLCIITHIALQLSGLA